MSAGQMKVRLPKDKIADFCRRHHIRKLAVFGSVLHGDSRPDSDLDILVEFEPGRVPGLAFFGMEQELSELLGRKVDLNTPQFLSPYFRDEVLAEAEVQYASS
jgi:predicted nucleotidyltransferase